MSGAAYAPTNRAHLLTDEQLAYHVARDGGDNSVLHRLVRVESGGVIAACHHLFYEMGYLVYGIPNCIRCMVT